ncbi:MAG: capsular biosynthesis protein, partial [Pseudomonadota bacterium]
MNDQCKISGKNAKPGSLFERADAAFGLENLGTSAVPKNLPASKRKAVRPKSEPEVTATAAPTAPVAAAPQTPTAHAVPKGFQAEPAPQPERAVQLCGPRIEIDRDYLHDAGLIIPEDTVTGLLEEFRIVKRELLA